MQPTAFSMLLRKYGTSPRSVAKRLGIQKREVKKWCRGIDHPNVWQAVATAKFMQCDLKELYLAIINTPYRRF